MTECNYRTKLEKLVNEKGISKIDLANQLDMTEEDITRVLWGIRFLGFEEFEKLCNLIDEPVHKVCKMLEEDKISDIVKEYIYIYDSLL